MVLINGISRFILGQISIKTFWYHLSDTTILFHPFILMCFVLFLGVAGVFIWGIRKITSFKLLMGLLFLSLISVVFYPALYWPKFKGTPYSFSPFFPSEKTILAPKDKKNLIFIFAESLENTYQDTTVFGENLTPKLTTWTQNNIHFDHFVQLNGSEFTSAAYVSMFCGLPLFVDLKSTLENHPLCVPNILKKAGYRMTFLKGATLEFGRTNQIVDYMGFDRTLGFQELFKNQRISYDHIGFHKWTLVMPPDRQLFQIAREEILDLAQRSVPFMMTITTADTHFPMGYLDTTCPQKNGDMRDVVRCADETLTDFLAWLEKQAFYENTLVVLVGDHLSMKSTLYDKLMSAKERGIYNVFIHAPKPPKTDRTFTSFDIGPTVLEMLRFEVPVLGYGKSLMRHNTTLIEETPEEFEEFLALGKPLKNQLGFYKGKQGLPNNQSPKSIRRIRRKIGRHNRFYPQ